VAEVQVCVWETVSVVLLRVEVVIDEVEDIVGEVVVVDDEMV